jgi:uncharacterized protein (TIGR02646 family)
MMPQLRPEEPAALAAGGPGWTRRWVLRCEAWQEDPSRVAPQFSWPKVDGAPLNQLLLPPLHAMSGGHCTWCDVWPVRPQTIEHLAPKGPGRFPELAYTWTNLYLACGECQKRGDAYDPAILRPDEPGYRFERYFLFNERDGRLQPHPAADAEDRRRAEVTLRLFRLNEGGMPEIRRSVMRRLRGQPDPADESCRYLIALAPDLA